MNCPQCNNETYIDHVTVNDGVTTYAYVCMNPKCQDYKKAYTLSGAETETQIKSQ